MPSKGERTGVRQGTSTTLGPHGPPLLCYQPAPPLHASRHPGPPPRQAAHGLRPPPPPPPRGHPPPPAPPTYRAPLWSDARPARGPQRRGPHKGGRPRAPPPPPPSQRCSPLPSSTPNVLGLCLEEPIRRQVARLDKRGGPGAIHARLDGHARRVGRVLVPKVAAGFESESPVPNAHVVRLEDGRRATKPGAATRGRRTRTDGGGRVHVCVRRRTEGRHTSPSTSTATNRHRRTRVQHQ